MEQNNITNFYAKAIKARAEEGKIVSPSTLEILKRQISLVEAGYSVMSNFYESDIVNVPNKLRVIQELAVIQGYSPKIEMSQVVASDFTVQLNQYSVFAKKSDDEIEVGSEQDSEGLIKLLN
ncbi:hypothetical protein KY334_05340 [Candidatus Woesearchaeota archaeon]|nr:hypothetical protein [Candidatus Woesearchaeota archaeon]